MHESLWSQTAVLPARAPLEKDLQTDVAVIGAGMAGILTAYTLAKRGVRVAVLEAERIASGQTQNTTAKITSQHGQYCDAFIKRFGLEAAQCYAQANQEAIEAYAELIAREKIDCAFVRTQSYIYSTCASQPLELEAAAAQQLHLPAHFCRQTELPFPVRGAVRFDAQARFHPLRFLGALCENLEIYEHTRAVSIEGDTIFTQNHTIRAEHIVFATHYPFVNVPGYYFLRMHQERSYVLALIDAMRPQGLYYGADADGLSLREAEGLLLLGGSAHRAGENSAGDRYALLRERAKALFPRSREVACWSAQDCITLDGIPYIGPFSAATPRWLVATGFGKWGMTSSMVAAQIIAGTICAHPPAWARVFSPARFHLSASAQNLATDTVQAFKGLVLETLHLPDETVSALPPDHGGIIDWNGRKAGVYKDEAGEVFAVHPRCPHLGCALRWNPDEKSWDCPCHGSRFGYDGTLLTGPAQRPLARMTD